MRTKKIFIIRSIFYGSRIVKAMYANRVSYWIDSKGPSYATDLGNASALACLQRAYSSINAGECEAAIVGGANYCNHPSVSINLRRYGFIIFLYKLILKQTYITG